jgi:tetratricopeptide (TPR) repeat protein
MDAHRLLVRAYTSLHDEAKLCAALERLADAAEATGAVEDERRALTRLARLAPDDQGNLARLEALGGPLFEEAGPAEAVAEEPPSFERFMIGEEAAARADEAPPVSSSSSDAPPPAAATGTTEFEWNSVAEPPAAPPSAADASASFADLNDLTDGGYDPAAQERASQTGFQEFDFTAPLTDAAAAESRGQASGASVERMLKQELESVEFYIEQGYADIARDTLDMLERQYGAHPEIKALRARVAPAEENVTTQGFDTPASFDDPAAFGAAFESDAAAGPASSNGVQEPSAFDPSAFEMPAAFEPPAVFEAPAAEPSRQASANSNSQTQAAAGAGIDPGLAAIFDEFREAVEDVDDEAASGDFDTHYQMGLAYREMGLLDQAVEEFQAATGMAAPGDGTPRFLQCCNMLGHCFMEKDMPRPAALWFKRGLDAPGHTEDEYQAMRYDLGTAYEQMGDHGRAIEVLSEVYAIDVSYRGVADRLRELQQKVVRG